METRLREDAKHLEHCAACWRRGVEHLRVDVETDAGALDGFEHLDQVRHRPAQPIG
jgi:hypothetical protein